MTKQRQQKWKKKKKGRRVKRRLFVELPGEDTRAEVRQWLEQAKLLEQYGTDDPESWPESLRDTDWTAVFFPK